MAPVRLCNGKPAKCCANSAVLFRTSLSMYYSKQQDSYTEAEDGSATKNGFPNFSQTRGFNTVYTKPRNRSLSTYDSSLLSLSCPTPSGPILILSSHLRLDSEGNIFATSSFPIEFFHALLRAPGVLQPQLQLGCPKSPWQRTTPVTVRGPHVQKKKKKAIHCTALLCNFSNIYVHVIPVAQQPS